MASKRMTSTGKWDQAWFRKLSPQLKCAWMFLCDKCDHAGIWDIDFDAMAFFIGADLSLDEIHKAFGERIKALGETKLLIVDFVDFQYGHLNPENRVHKSVLDRLEKEGAIKGFKSPLQGAKDKAKDLDKEKDKEPRNPDELFASLPETLLAKLFKKYDESWIRDQVVLCFEHYTLGGKKVKSWPQTVSGWFGRSHNPVLKITGGERIGTMCGVATDV